jgi:peptidoglycan-N-acetylglucosamine deacetylase
MSIYLKVKILFLVATLALVVLSIFQGISIWFIVIVVALYFAVVSFGVFNLWAGFFVPVKYRGDKNTQTIALTFDDGPVPGKTEKILAILREHHVNASFFCIGSRVATHPEVLNNIDKQGHLVCNHTFSHSTTIDFFPASRIIRELLDTDEAIYEVLGRRPVFFRPPYGITNPMIAAAVKAGKYLVVGWSLRSFDTLIKDPERLMNRAARSLKAGDIILFHDYSDSTIAILPSFIKHVQEKGFKIVRLDALLNEKPYR